MFDPIENSYAYLLMGAEASGVSPSEPNKVDSNQFVAALEEAKAELIQDPILKRPAALGLASDDADFWRNNQIAAVDEEVWALAERKPDPVFEAS